MNGKGYTGLVCKGIPVPTEVQVTHWGMAEVIWTALKSCAMAWAKSEAKPVSLAPSTYCWSSSQRFAGGGGSREGQPPFVLLLLLASNNHLYADVSVIKKEVIFAAAQPTSSCTVCTTAAALPSPGMGEDTPMPSSVPASLHLPYSVLGFVPRSPIYHYTTGPNHNLTMLTDCTQFWKMEQVNRD